MTAFKFNKQTSAVALAFFSIYLIYGIFYRPVLQLVVSLAAGGIAFGIFDSYEVATVVLLAMNFAFPLFRGSSMKGIKGEGFVNAEAITKRITGMKGVIKGVASPMSEGFADAQEEDMTLEKKDDEKESLDDVPTTSKKALGAPASAAIAGLNAESIEKILKLVASTSAESVTKNQGSTAPVANSANGTDIMKNLSKISEQGVPPAQQPATEKFEDNGGLFKLGQIPTDKKGGHHMDTGTTVMNAINSLKPDQIKAMTMDTKQLIDTQKSLMSMLQTFQPMVAEGKQRMDTFQGMFGGASMGAQPA